MKNIRKTGITTTSFDLKDDQFISLTLKNIIICTIMKPDQEEIQRY